MEKNIFSDKCGLGLLKAPFGERVVGERGQKDLPPGTEEGEKLKPDRHYEHKQHAFDSYCKKVLKCEAYNGDEEIAADNAYVYIDKELTRASKRAIEMLGQKDIYHVFTPLFPNTSTRVILKKPKTDSSIRKVWLPKTLAYILREWKASQDELRGFLGDEYQDYDLVVALPNGRPCEDRIILKEFEKLREKTGLPRVVFHSLRHSSTTYKLKLNHGDLKATQGDTGHAEIDMITSVYAHILDEDRKINAQKFESAFYANPDLRSVRPPEEEKEPAPAALDLEALVEQLRKSPELANTLAALLSATPGGK